MNNLLYTTILKAADESFPVFKIGRPRVHHRDLLNAFFTVLRTGMQWRALPSLDFRTAHRHFIRWARAGVFELAYKRLHKLASRRTRQHDFLAIDTTFIKSIYGMDVVGRNPTDRGRMATKMIAVVDGRGLPTQIGFVGANVSDHVAIKRIIPSVRCLRPKRVYADKGFDSNETRTLMRTIGLLPRIARRGKTTKIWEETRRRVVERFFSWLDKSRRIIVRYDTTIVAYAAWTWLACCRLAHSRQG